MMSTIAIFFTACAALCAALNNVSAAYCALISLSPAALAAGVEQEGTPFLASSTSRFSRISATGRVLEAKTSSNASCFFGIAIPGVPLIISSSLLNSLTSSLHFRPVCLYGTFVPSGDSQGVLRFKRPFSLINSLLLYHTPQLQEKT